MLNNEPASRGETLALTALLSTCTELATAARAALDHGRCLDEDELDDLGVYSANVRIASELLQHPGHIMSVLAKAA